MSIINEALKKTQNNLNAAPSSPSQFTQDANEPSKAAPAGGKKLQTIFAGVLILGLISWAFINFQPKLLSFFSNTNIPTLSPPVAESKPSHRVKTKKPAVRPASNNSSLPFVLNGIIENHGKMAALINGEVYEEGDLIKGKTITRITFNDVELSDETGVTILNVR